MNTCPLTLDIEVQDNLQTPRKAEWLHLLLVTRGAISVRWGDGTVAMPAGTLVAGAGPWAVVAQAEVSRWRVLGFHPGVVNDAWAAQVLPEDLGAAAAMDHWLIEPLLAPRPTVLTLPAGFSTSLDRSLEQARRAVEGKGSPYWRCFARGHLFDVLQGLRRHLETGSEPPLPAPSPASPWTLERLVYLHAELARRPTLARAAREAGMNRDAFSRRVKAETGRTFHELLTDLRLRKAEWLVRQTVLPLARVAEEVGLRDQTHFTRLFKAHYAETPSRYRQAHSGQKAEIF